MKIIFVFLGIILVSFIAIPANTYGKPKPGSADLRIILIRHGEKPDKGDNLSCAGFNRAIKLVPLLKNKFGIPDYIYVPAPSTGKQTQNCRMLQTIMPFAIKYNLPINTSFNVDGTDLLTKKIRKHTGTVFVVWEHKQLRNMVTMLGIKAVDKWTAEDFDTIYVITYHNGKAILTTDHEGITPSAGCGF